MTTRNIIASAEFSGEPVFINNDGSMTPYISRDVVGHREMYGASLHLVFKHTADFHMTMLEILAEKYDLSVDDMLEKIHGDERFTNMVVNPTIHAMGYFEKEDLEKKIPAPESQPQVSEAPQAPKKMIKVKRPQKAPEATPENSPKSVKKVKKPQVIQPSN
jgi:hypothetical protein